MVDSPHDIKPTTGNQARKTPAECLQLHEDELFTPLIDQAMPDALFIHDHNGRFLKVNRRACTSLGYTRVELLTMSVTDVEQDFDLASAQAAWNGLQSGIPMILNGHQRRKDGSVFPVEVHFGLMEREGERLYIGVVRDITEREHEKFETQRHSELLQALARQQVAVQTVAAFAHELNQPLFSISVYSEVALRALRSGNKPDLLAHTVEGCHEQAMCAGRVLHELIDHLHKDNAESRPFDMNNLVKDVVNKMQKVTFHRFHARLDLDPELPLVSGNRLQAENVLVSLIQNGIEAMDEAGTAPAYIAIAVRRLTERNMAHVSVRDGGQGLNADAARRIFDPFFTTKPEGLGLGLIISRSLIEAQGGQLWFDSEGSPGAVFHFTLPLARG